MKIITFIGILAGIGGFLCLMNINPLLAALSGSLAVCNSILFYGLTR